MHGLVCVDKEMNPLRPSIIWCDSRAVPYGEKAFHDLTPGKCLPHLLNSPGNFTATKLAWVKENEPELFKKIYKIMLPGDYIATRMTGEACTTASGLSEGILWDFKDNQPASFMMKYFGFDESLLPSIKPTFSIHGLLTSDIARELDLAEGTPVAYRAGDQPNNAFSLNVINPGEIAATAGTSGVVYGVSDEIKYDPQSRVNSFAHVNHSVKDPRLGVLMCVSGTGILNSWVRKNTIFNNASYEDINIAASTIPIGSEGLSILPFGNGAERILGNKETGAFISNINFNTHSAQHIARAAQEGIVFALCYGLEIMKETGIKPSVIRAGKANMFLSPIFRNTLAGITGATIELYNTDGSIGAAIGAGVGAGIYKSFKDAFAGLKKIDTINPDAKMVSTYQEAYKQWKTFLKKIVLT